MCGPSSQEHHINIVGSLSEPIIVQILLYYSVSCLHNSRPAQLSRDRERRMLGCSLLTSLVQKSDSNSTAQTELPVTLWPAYGAVVSLQAGYDSRGRAWPGTFSKSWTFLNFRLYLYREHSTTGGGDRKAGCPSSNQSPDEPNRSRDYPL